MKLSVSVGLRCTTRDQYDVDYVTGNSRWCHSNVPCLVLGRKFTFSCRLLDHRNPIPVGNVLLHYEARSLAPIE